MKQKSLNILWIFLMVVVGFVNVPYAEGASVVIEPPNVTLNNVGDTTFINISAKEVTNLQGFQFIVKFDPAIIKVNTSQINPFFVFPVRNVIDNVNGTVDIVASAFTGISGDVLLVTLNVEGVSFGTTSLSITNRVVNNVNLAILKNTSAVEIPSTLSPGEITVGAIDGDGGGYPATEDCNDADASVNPGAFEACNGKDDNCNELIDDSPAGAD